MKQINNGFAPCYMLTKEGKVYNSSSKKYLKMDIKHHSFKLKLENSIKYKTITLKELYRLVYNENYCIDNIENLAAEEWREIADTNKIYYISNLGRVKSKAGYEARILKPIQNKRGYNRVDIVIAGKKYTKLIHRLTAAAFLEPPQNIDYQLHHKDYNKNNNAASNLEWLSIAQHAQKHAERREQLKNGGI